MEPIITNGILVEKAFWLATITTGCTVIAVLFKLLINSHERTVAYLQAEIDRLRKEQSDRPH